MSPKGIKSLSPPRKQFISFPKENSLQIFINLVHFTFLPKKPKRKTYLKANEYLKKNSNMSSLPTSVEKKFHCVLEI